MHPSLLVRPLFFAALAILGGCASIVSESTYPVAITSTPSGASYQITNEDGAVVRSGVTPDNVMLKAGSGYFDGETYKVTYQKDGYTGNTAVLNSGVDGWYWGNILFGGIIGMLIVDPISGAMFTLPQGASASLDSIPAPAQVAVTPSVSAAPSSKKEQQLNELAADKSLSYDEYLRRHQIITRED
ncbi:hypothetical protein [Pseudomonas putida]